MVDPSSVVGIALPLLVKYLPEVWKAARSLGSQTFDKITDSILDKASESIADQSWETGRKLIKKLSTTLTSDSPVQRAMEDLAIAPDNSLNQGILNLQLQKLLDADGELLREIAAILQTNSPSPITIIASGDRSVAAQNQNAPAFTGDFQGGVHITIKK